MGISPWVIWIDRDKYLDLKITVFTFFGMETAPHIRLILWKAAKAVEGVDRASIAESGLHLLSALKHHLIDKDRTLHRMMGR